MIFHPCLPLFFTSLLALVHPPKPLAHQASRHIKQTRAEPRRVSVLIDLIPDYETTPNGKTVFPVHSALWVSGTDQDGPLKIEISVAEDASDFDENLRVRVLDMTTAKSGQTYQANARRKVTTEIGTQLTNQEFMDPATGKGIVANAWAKDIIYRTGSINKGNINTCNNFIQRLVEGELGGTLSDEAKGQFDLARIWTEDFNPAGATQEVKKMRYDTTRDGAKQRKEFNVLEACSKAKNKRDDACNANVAPDDDKPPTKVDNFNEKNELALDPVASNVPDDQLRLPEDGGLSPSSPPPNTISTDQGTKISLARAGGSLQAFTAVAKDALQTLGVAGTVVGAVFVILDFVDHNWVGGAIGAAGIAVGVAAGAAISGPLGWVVGGILTVLFASKSLSTSQFHSLQIPMPGAMNSL